MEPFMSDQKIKIPPLPTPPTPPSPQLLTLAALIATIPERPELMKHVHAKAFPDCQQVSFGGPCGCVISGEVVCVNRKPAKPIR